MKPQLIVFDWAGTTVDYGCFAPVNAFALAFQKFGVTPTVEEIRAPMGMLKRDHIRTMLAMPAIQRQWQENQGAADEAAVEKLYGVFEASLLESLAQYADPKPGVLEGSSVLGLTQEEYEALPPQDRERVLARAKETFLAAGADGVLLNLSQLPQWLEEQEKED